MCSTRQSFILKGGNALRFAHGGNRSTIDLDFTAARETLDDDAEVIRERLNGAFQNAESRFQIRLRCQRVIRRPKVGRGTHPTYDIGVGFQFPNDRYYADFADKNTTRSVPTVIPVEVSINDLVCETENYSPWAGSKSSLLVCSLDDILAEKLRSLLQQPIRHRNREQDVYDCASFLRSSRSSINIDKVYLFLIQKCAARKITPVAASFDGQVREMARQNYQESIRRQTGKNFIPFDEAWREVVNFIGDMPWGES